jgi:hypothetical protein
LNPNSIEDQSFLDNPEVITFDNFNNYNLFRSSPIEHFIYLYQRVSFSLLVLCIKFSFLRIE